MTQTLHMNLNLVFIFPLGFKHHVEPQKLISKKIRKHPPARPLCTRASVRPRVFFSRGCFSSASQFLGWEFCLFRGGWSLWVGISFCPNTSSGQQSSLYWMNWCPLIDNVDNLLVLQLLGREERKCENSRWVWMSGSLLIRRRCSALTGFCNW